MKRLLLCLLALLLFTACQEKAKPAVTINPKLEHPISCMKLNTLNVEKDVLGQLKELYGFDESCSLVLIVSYKKDIVCNSPQNVHMNSVGKFPKSYLKFELRIGLEVQYTYYIDLYSNVDSDDIEEGFKRLERDLIKLERQNR
ncbi:MAG: hypothetical protein K0U38_10365 [Epsilonproteobacteria bacterium]|nr:hypothetical protein [Campylobacterota bacterium]